MLKRRAGGMYYFKKTLHGKTTEKSLRTRNRQDAERLAGRWLDDLYRGDKGWENAVAFEVWWARFARTYLPQMTRSAQYGFTRAVGKVLPLWTGRPLNKITRQECQAFVPRRLAEGAAPGTVALERQLLKALFNRAVEDELLVRSPWAFRQPIKVRARERVLSRDEERVLLAAAPARLARILQLILWTGLRMHELEAAGPQNLIQLPVPGIKVLGKGRKTRVIPLGPEALALAKTLLPIGTRPYVPKLVRLLARVNQTRTEPIPHFTFHDLRRTFATRCAEGGMPMAILSELLGHSSIQLTAKYYVHISNTTAAAALADILRGDRSGDTSQSLPQVVAQ